MTLVEKMLAAWGSTTVPGERLAEIQHARLTLAGTGRDVDWNRAAAEAIQGVLDARGQLRLATD